MVDLWRSLNIPRFFWTGLLTTAPNLRLVYTDLYLYKYSSIMTASTTTVIALRHIHIYGMIVLWSSQCCACQSSQAKQCHMTQLRERMRILLFCLHV